MGTDLQTFLSRPAKQLSDPTRQLPGPTKRLLGMLLAVLHTAAAGFTGAVIAGMVRQSLIREESYALVLLLVFLTAAYAIAGDVIDRARVYEVLFWFVTAPLVVMLLVATKEIDLSYYKPQISAGIASIARSTYAVFGCFGAMSAVLFLPVESKTMREKAAGAERKLRRTVWSAFTTAIVILLIAYYVMIGTFGEKALSVLPYPVITLMSMIQFKGGFLKRLDAIMLAVWFFTLFALLSLNLYNGSFLLHGAIAPENKKKSGTGAHITVLAAAFLAGLVIGNREDARQQLIRFFLYIQLPLYLLLPGMFAAMAENPAKERRCGENPAKESEYGEDWPRRGMEKERE
jgi:hypothetical protein